MELIKSPIVIGALSGAVVLIMRSLIAALVIDVTKRLSFSLLFLKLFSAPLSILPSHPLWSDWRAVGWNVSSKNFMPDNCDTVKVYRVFSMVGFEAKVTRADGQRLPYKFIGKLSREETILTGEWYDSGGKSGNYHGSFQLRYLNAKSKAEGKWIGFSETIDKIKVGEMFLEKLESS